MKTLVVSKQLKLTVIKIFNVYPLKPPQMCKNKRNKLRKFGHINSLPTNFHSKQCHFILKGGKWFSSGVRKNGLVSWHRSLVR